MEQHQTNQATDVALVAHSKPGWALSIDSLICQIQDEESAREAIDNVEMLKNRLVEQKALKKYACEFCKLEALMWCHIASSGIDVDDSDLFTKREKSLVAWLRDMTDSHRMKVMAKCATGMRLSNVKDSETTKRNRDDVIAEFERICAGIVERAEETGQTTLNKDVFIDSWRLQKVPSDDSITAFRERTKNALIRKGFHSPGDGGGLYLSPPKMTPVQRAEVIANLSGNVIDSIRSLAEECDKLGEPVTASMIEHMLAEVGKLALRGK